MENNKIKNELNNKIDSFKTEQELNKENFKNNKPQNNYKFLELISFIYNHLKK